MAARKSLEEMFKYEGDCIRLTGFPLNNLLGDISNVLGTERLMEDHRWQQGGRGAWYAHPAFDPKSARQRQAFFKRMDSPSGSFLKNFFSRAILNPRQFSDCRSYEEFFDLCSSVSGAVATARKSLEPYRDLDEAVGVLDRITEFEREYGSLLETLKAIDAGSVFAFDVESGEVAMMPKMPRAGRIPRKNAKSGMDFDSDWLYDIRLAMKKMVAKYQGEVWSHFRTGVLDFVRSEFSIDGGDNLRRSYERFALPVRFARRYQLYLDGVEEYPSLGVADEARAIAEHADMGFEGEIDPRAFVQMYNGLAGPLVPEPIYPKFGKHYDVQGLFPPLLMKKYGYYCDDRFIPIDFQTEEGESKFLLAGLHSGCKSFYLKNLALLSILGQAGLRVPAGSATIPKYDHIYYYRNVSESTGGSFQSEVADVDRIIKKSGKHDLVLVDEFLDKGDNEVAAAFGPKLLDRFLQTDATVFVISHRSEDYRTLESNGWTLMTPDYAEFGSDVVPLKRLRRGAPDPGINLRYMEQVHRDLIQ